MSAWRQRTRRHPARGDRSAARSVDSAFFAGRDDYRILVTGGRLVVASAVIGQLVDADTVVLLGIDIDLYRSG